MQFLHRLQCDGLSNVRILRLFSSTLSKKKCTQSTIARNSFIANCNSKHKMVGSVRYVQTFGGGDGLGGIRGKIADYLTGQTTQYVLWFVGCMSLVFFTASTAQKHRYKSSSEHTGHSSVMDADQLESLKNKKKGVTGDKKGLDDIMDELYDQHVASKDLDDWENIRTPRPDEPETYEANQAKRAAVINRRSDLEAKEFTSGDYGKIEEKDISLDFNVDVVEESIGRGKQLKYYGKVGGVELPASPVNRRSQ